MDAINSTTGEELYERLSTLKWRTLSWNKLIGVAMAATPNLTGKILGILKECKILYMKHILIGKYCVSLYCSPGGTKQLL
jgi:hypothetical protein